MAGNQPARQSAGAFDFKGWLARGAQFLDAEARAKGGDYARQLGNAAGVVRAGVHGLQGMHDDVVLAGRILNPLDRVLNPPEQKPLQPVINAANNIVDYAFNAPFHPGRVATDVGNQLSKWNTELNPYATPQADTLGGELNRNFQIGMNQGEVGADAAALAFGTGALKAAPRLAPISEAAETAKFIDQGFEPKLAQYLAERYDGKGHHAVIPSRFKFPDKLLNVPLPSGMAGRPLTSVLSDSPLNVLKPYNISRGDFYKLHYQVDPKMNTARLPASFGGAWNGKALGLQKFGLLGRIWHGSPALLNTSVGLGGLSSLQTDSASAPADGETQTEDQQ